MSLLTKKSKWLLYSLGLCALSQTVLAYETGGIYRGFDVDASKVTQQDIKDLAKLHANLVRVSFNNLPMLEQQEPYSLNKKSFNKLDQILDWCERSHIGVVIDPHTFPGTVSKWTILPSDLFWKDYRWHKLSIDLWSEIAKRYSHRGDVIAGYDLLNEPNVPAQIVKGGPMDVNALLAKLVSAVRRYDTTHYIILEGIGGPDRLGYWRYMIEGVRTLELPKDERLVVSVHVYNPFEFTHQGIPTNPKEVFKLPPLTSDKYPGTIAGTYWDKERIRRLLSPVVEFQKKHNIPIFIGEFSAARWTGDSGNRYLQDLIDIFEENGWGWAYHAYRASPVWDPEMSNYDLNDQKHYTDTPRLRLLQAAFKANDKKMGGFLSRNPVNE